MRWSARNSILRLRPWTEESFLLMGTLPSLMLVALLLSLPAEGALVLAETSLLRVTNLVLTLSLSCARIPGSTQRLSP